MAYNWAQLAFVEKWRLQAVRGRIVGMHRPADRTFFDLRLRPGEGNVGAIASTVDVHLVDAGDIIKEKRVVLLDKASVVIRVVGQLTPPDADVAARTTRLLETGAVIAGDLASAEDDIAVLNIGFPVVVQLPEPLQNSRSGEALRVVITEPPKGFLVV